MRYAFKIAIRYAYKIARCASEKLHENTSKHIATKCVVHM